MGFMVCAGPPGGGLPGGGKPPPSSLRRVESPGFPRRVGRLSILDRRKYMASKSCQSALLNAGAWAIRVCSAHAVHHSMPCLATTRVLLGAAISGTRERSSRMPPSLTAGFPPSEIRKNDGPCMTAPDLRNFINDLRKIRILAGAVQGVFRDAACSLNRVSSARRRAFRACAHPSSPAQSQHFQFVCLFRRRLLRASSQNHGQIHHPTQNLRCGCQLFSAVRAVESVCLCSYLRTGQLMIQGVFSAAVWQFQGACTRGFSALGSRELRISPSHPDC